MMMLGSDADAIGRTKGGLSEVVFFLLLDLMTITAAVFVRARRMVMRILRKAQLGTRIGLRLEDMTPRVHRPLPPLSLGIQTLCPLELLQLCLPRRAQLTVRFPSSICSALSNPSVFCRS